MFVSGNLKVNVKSLFSIECIPFKQSLYLPNYLLLSPLQTWRRFTVNCVFSFFLSQFYKAIQSSEK